MNSIATTRMSSGGQVVIPETIRKRGNLQPGAQFVVVCEDDVVILKAIEKLGMEDFDRLIKEAHNQVRTSGLRRKVTADVLSNARSRK